MKFFHVGIIVDKRIGFDDCCLRLPLSKAHFRALNFKNCYKWRRLEHVFKSIDLKMKIQMHSFFIELIPFTQFFYSFKNLYGLRIPVQNIFYDFMFAMVAMVLFFAFFHQNIFQIVFSSTFIDWLIDWLMLIMSFFLACLLYFLEILMNTLLFFSSPQHTHEPLILIAVFRKRNSFCLNNSHDWSIAFISV